MKLVLVTGASGFLGTALTAELLSRGVAVRALIRSQHNAEFLHDLGAEIVVGDIRDSAIYSAAADVDTVIHCAAVIGSPMLPPEAFQTINVDGTRNLVEALKNNNCLQRFVHVSTVAVVGETDPRFPAREDAECRPLDVYGETKLLGERVILDAVSTGFPAVVVRPMWIYGSRSKVTAKLFHKIASRKLPMVGPAKNTMQPVAVEDAVDGILKCAATPGIEGRIYNLAGPETLTIRSMCETIAEVVGATLPNVALPLSVAIPLAAISERFFPAMGIDPPLTRQKLEFFRLNNSYSIDRARRELGWNPKITFREGAHKIAQELGLAPRFISQTSPATSRKKA